MTNFNFEHRKIGLVGDAKLHANLVTYAFGQRADEIHRYTPAPQSSAIRDDIEDLAQWIKDRRLDTLAVVRGDQVATLAAEVIDLAGTQHLDRLTLTDRQDLRTGDTILSIKDSRYVVTSASGGLAVAQAIAL